MDWFSRITQLIYTLAISPLTETESHRCFGQSALSHKLRVSLTSPSTWPGPARNALQISWSSLERVRRRQLAFTFWYTRTGSSR